MFKRSDNKSTGSKWSWWQILLAIFVVLHVVFSVVVIVFSASHGKWDIAARYTSTLGVNLAICLLFIDPLD